MGPRAQELFAEAGIKVVLGVTSKVEDVIKQLIEGTLKEGDSLCEHGHNLSKTEYKHSEEKNILSKIREKTTG
jgi:predicted Fe-Mo cluster-binding NifX family protein